MGRWRIDRLGRPGGALLADDGGVIVGRAYVANGVISRMVGMLGTPDPRADEALVLVPCAAVHGVGLRTPIGAAFVDRLGVVLRVVDPLPPRGATCRGAHAVVEAAAGVLALAPGDRVHLSALSVFPLGGDFPPSERGSTRGAVALSAHREHTAPPDDRRM